MRVDKMEITKYDAPDKFARLWASLMARLLFLRLFRAVGDVPRMAGTTRTREIIELAVRNLEYRRETMEYAILIRSLTVLNFTISYQL